MGKLCGWKTFNSREYFSGGKKDERFRRIGWDNAL